MKKLSVCIFTLTLCFALATAFKSKEDTFGVLSKSFAVSSGGTESTAPGDLYNSYVAEVIEAETNNPTVGCDELIAEAEAICSRSIEEICFADESNKICLARVTKTEGSPDSYSLDCFISGEYSCD